MKIVVGRVQLAGLCVLILALGAPRVVRGGEDPLCLVGEFGSGFTTMYGIGIWEPQMKLYAVDGPTHMLYRYDVSVCPGNLEVTRSLPADGAGLAIDQMTGDVFVVSPTTGEVYKYDKDLNPVNNVINGTNHWAAYNGSFPINFVAHDPMNHQLWTGGPNGVVLCRVFDNGPSSVTTFPIAPDGVGACRGLAVYGQYLYISNSVRQIRRVDLTTQVYSEGGFAACQNLDPPPNNDFTYAPGQVAVDADGQLYVSFRHGDGTNGIIRKYGPGCGGQIFESLAAPGVFSLAVDSHGGVYASNLTSVRWFAGAPRAASSVTFIYRSGANPEHGTIHWSDNSSYETAYNVYQAIYPSTSYTPLTLGLPPNTDSLEVVLPGYQGRTYRIDAVDEYHNYSGSGCSPCAPVSRSEPPGQSSVPVGENSAGGLRVFPSPGAGHFRILMDLAPTVGSPTGNERAELLVFDISGRPIYRKSMEVVIPGHLDERWDGTDAEGAEAPAGLYLVALKRPGHPPIVSRLVKTR